MPTNQDSTEREQVKTRDMRVFRILMTMIGSVFMAMGLLPILTGHYYARTTKYGSHEVVLDGAPAISMGFVLLFLGMLPLGAWFKTAPRAVNWCLLCLACSGTAFYFSLQLAK